jgi:hypothetical protein
MDYDAKQAAPETAAIRPFHFSAPEAELTELRRRIGATRWPEKETVADDSQGVPLATIPLLLQPRAMSCLPHCGCIDHPCGNDKRYNALTERNSSDDQIHVDCSRRISLDLRREVGVGAGCYPGARRIRFLPSRWRRVACWIRPLRLAC